MIIALSGYARTGKDQVADFIKEAHQSFEIKKFSGKLKQMATMLTGITDIESQQSKASKLGTEWGNMTVRDLLQKLGTDAIRDGLHPDAWVNALMSDYVGMYDIDLDKITWPDWIITDCRFPNEARAVKQLGGIVIRIIRPGIGPINDHPSETALDSWPFDLVLYNNGTLEELKQKSLSIL